MSDQNGSAAPTQKDVSNPTDTTSFDKGKGKGKANEAPVAQDVSMGEEETEDDTSEDEADETAATADDADDDNMEEIDLNNIIDGGRRTRGRQIDFAKAAEELPEDDDDDEDDDEDFEEPAEEDKMEE